MKTKIFTLFLAVVASIGILRASDTEVNGIWYDFDETTRTASVTYKGTRYNSYSDEYSGEVTIPASVEYSSITYSVTSIGGNAFRGCSGLTSVTIGNSVTSIESSAFSDCSGLTKVNITDIAAWCNIAFSDNESNPLYYANHLYVNDVEVTNLVIPEGVTSIGNYAFQACYRLTSVTIPNSVTSIGNSAFYLVANIVYNGAATGSPWGARSVNGYVEGNLVYSDAAKTNLLACFSAANGDIVIPNTVKSIGERAFYGCYSLTSVTIPNSVTSIGDYAFYGCSGLTSITIPNSVTSIGEGAFYDCYSLTSVTIGNSVTSIGEGAFLGCSGLTSITIPNSVTSIGDYAFYDCSGLTSVTIGNSVTSIGNEAFYECTGLTSITIPNSVTSIGNDAFYGCSGLTSVTIPNSVTSIGGNAFRGCSGLTSVTIPNSVTSIESSAFSNCSGLTKVNITDIAAWCNIAFSDNESNPLYYANHLYVNDVEVTNLVIPEGVTSIGNYAFQACYRLTSVTIPNSVTSIGKSAFSGCYGLTSITIPNSGTRIGDYAFYSCSGLTSVTIGNSVTSIGREAFSFCYSLTSVTIGNSVTSIGERAFFNCSVSTINYIGSMDEWCNKAWSPGSISSNYHLQLNGVLQQSAVIPNSVTSIGQNAFSSCSSLTSVTIPNSVTSIGERAFYGCSKLTSVTIPNSVTSIGQNAFSGCTGLTSIYSTCGDLERVKQLLNNDGRVTYAPLKYTITGNVNIEGAGSVQVPQNECEDVIAIPNYGYHFTQWSDGNTNNPRTIVLTQDTTFTAEFGIDKSGTCGENNALMWTYDDISKTLTITGNGTLNSNYTFGIEAPTQMQTLIIGDQVTAVGNYAFNSRTTIQKIVIGSNVTSIGDYAFADINNRQLANLVMPAELLTIGDYAFSGNTYLESIDFNAKLQGIGAYAFNNCFRVSEMTCLATITPDLGTDALASINSIASLCVPAECLRKYQIDPNWGRFALCELGASSTTTDQNVTVTPNENSAIVTWPTNNNAATYTLQITKDGVVFCTLIFNGAGQLIGISFAPSRDGSSHAPAATVSVAGMSFTVTGLDGASKYAFSLSVADDNNQELVYYQGEFATTGYEGEVVPGGEPVTPGGGTTAINNVNSVTQSVGTTKFFHNGQLFIQRGGKTYSVTGQEVK